MTRLQKGLSQIRTTEQLAHILGETEEHILHSIGMTPDDKLMHCGRCSKCVMRGHPCLEITRDYVNAEIPEPESTSNCSTEIITMREDARRVLLTFMKKRFLKGESGVETGMILSHSISLLESIGLFEHEELRNEFLQYLEKLA